MGHLIRKAQQFHRRSGIAAADDGGTVALRHGSRHALVPMAKFANSNTPMGPFHIRSWRPCLGAELLWSRDRCPCPPAVGNCLPGTTWRRIVVESLAVHNVIDGQQQPHALALRLGDLVPAELDAVRVHLRITDGAAHGVLEGIAHSAADDQRVHLAEQVADDARAYPIPWRRPGWRRRAGPESPGPYP